MNWAAQTVADFGRSMGMSDLQFNEDGIVSLSVERTGDLYIEHLDSVEEVLVYLVRELPVGRRRDNYLRALQLSHWTENNPFLVTPALAGEDRLLFSTRIGNSDFTLPTLERAINFLEKLHDEVDAS